MKGNLTRRGERSWRLKFDAGRNPVTGKREIKYVTLKGHQGAGTSRGDQDSRRRSHGRICRSKPGDGRDLR